MQHFDNSSEAQARATESTFEFEGQPVCVRHHDGKLVGMNMMDVLKAMGLGVQVVGGDSEDEAKIGLVKSSRAKGKVLQFPGGPAK